MSLAELFGANLRHIRKGQGLTQEALAERVEISSDMVSKMERGAASPSFETLEKLCGALECEPIAFFGLAPTVAPMGQRLALLRKIHTTLSRMSEDQMARASKILQALVD